MTLSSIGRLQKIWSRTDNTKNLIQGVSISKNPLSLTYSILAPEARRQTSDTLKFVIREEPRVIESQGL